MALAEKEMKRQIYLLTDGAVHNTQEVVKLIDKCALATNTRVHTLGVGNGASTELIKESANAGAGSYHFVENNSEIEETVIFALQKNYSPVYIVQAIKALNEKNQHLQNVLTEKDFESHKNLRAGKTLNVGLVKGNSDFKKISQLLFEVLDPNSGLVSMEIRPVVRCGDEANNLMIGQICAKLMLNDSSLTNETKIELSKTFNVLHPLTSMVAKLDFGNDKMQEIEEAMVVKKIFAP